MRGGRDCAHLYVVPRELESDEQLALSVHMMTCTGCKRMHKQLSVMHNAHSELAPRAENTKARLPEDARQRLNDRMLSGY